VDDTLGPWKHSSVYPSCDWPGSRCGIIWGHAVLDGHEPEPIKPFEPVHKNPSRGFQRFSRKRKNVRPDFSHGKHDFFHLYVEDQPYYNHAFEIENFNKGIIF
jgi:hypothetical protein